MFYNKTKEEVLKNLKSRLSGLNKYEIKNRLKIYGYNKLKKEKRFSALKIFLSQFSNALVIILIFATIISFLLKAYIDAYVILGILILNAVLGFIQEYKAERSIKLLKKLISPKSKVIRDGVEQEINSKCLVPGDILILEEGDTVDADARLLHVVNLQTNESTLTGESIPVIKDINKLSDKIPLAERTNMVFSGTTITSGHGKAIVISIGMETEVGKIARLVQEVKEERTPLQNRLRKLGITLGLFVIIICFLVFGLSLLKHIDFMEGFFTALSLAVSAIPEGLPAVVTICLAIGVQRMYKKKSLIRKLQAIETLGNITIIASDKTGTLTKNEMEVTEIFVNKMDVKLKEKDFYYKSKKLDVKKFNLLLKIGASCNNANLPNLGDPTELALLKLAEKGNIKRNETRLHEIPFSSDKKYMITTHKVNGEKIDYMKGAVEKVLEKCKYYWHSGKVIRLTVLEKERILEKAGEMGDKALRVLAMSYSKDKDFIFVGLVGMIDPPRKEVKNAIEVARKAGIETIMVTGDHKSTAVAIGNLIGIKGKVIEGKDLEKINETELRKLVKDVKIFARVDSAHKVRILEALQKNDEVVAMTGDGVNDAPALKKADVGVSMSIKGTDVARDASDMVLVDDNYASIVSAVKEGRVIYDNIKKFVKFLLSANFDEVTIILCSLIAGLPLPLIPLQILWLNLVTDSFPALALGVDPGEKGIMKRKPRDKKEHILSNTIGFILTAGILAAVVTFGIFGWEYFSTGNLAKARTLALTTSIFFELFFVFSCRSVKHTIFELKRNKWLIYAVLLSALLHVGLIYSPLGSVFKLVQLNLLDWGKIILLSLSGFIFFEVRKVIKRGKYVTN